MSQVTQCDGCGTTSKEAHDWAHLFHCTEDESVTRDYCPECLKKMLGAV